MKDNIRTRFLLYSTACWLIAGSLSEAARSINADSLVRSQASASAVRFNVSVTDNRGLPFIGLTRENFVVTLSKVQQTIDFFSEADAPASICVLYDKSGSMKVDSGKVGPISDGLVRLARLSNPGSEFCVVGFAAKPELLLDWHSGPDEIKAGLQKLSQAQPHGTSALFDAINFAIRLTQKRPTTRHALIVITDSLENGSAMRLSELRTVLRQSDALFYSVIAAGPGTDSLTSMDQSVLRDMSGICGGQSFFTASEAETRAELDAIASQIRHLYTIGFRNSTLTSSSAPRPLKVKLAGTGGKAETSLLPTKLSKMSVRCKEAI